MYPLLFTPANPLGGFKGKRSLARTFVRPLATSDCQSNFAKESPAVISWQCQKRFREENVETTTIARLLDRSPRPRGDEGEKEREPATEQIR